jgi:hypothetical protein
MSRTPFMDAVACTFRDGVAPGPPSNPDVEYVQLGILSGRRLVQDYWGRSVPVECDFITHRAGNAKRIVVAGVGPYFNPVARSEALVWCVAPFVELVGYPDMRESLISGVPLNELAEWVRSHALPGGARSWRRNVRFSTVEYR